MGVLHTVMIVLTSTTVFFTNADPLSSSFCVCATKNESWNNQDCKSLEEHLNPSNGAHIPNNSVFNFCPGAHILTEPQHITGAWNITLRAAAVGETVVIKCTSDNAGIQFLNITGLAIEDINVYNCGMHANVYGNHTVKAALVFLGGEDLTLKSLIASQSLVAAISLVDVAGHVSVEDSIFANASISQENEQLYTLGNFIGYNSWTGKDVLVEVKNTRFENNTHPQQNSTCNYEDRRLSAGLSVILRQGNVAVSLSNVTLRGNNGCAGGNMAVVLFDMYKLVNTTHISVDGSTIEGGQGNVGGGIFVTLVNKPGSPTNTTTHTIDGSASPLPLLHIRNSTFTNNVANNVGGAIYLKHLEARHFSSPGIVIIEGCTFSGNRFTGKESGGMALHMTTYIVREHRSHQRPQVKMFVSLCNFTEQTHSGTGRLGDAVVFVKTSPHFHLNNTSITDNNSTGLLALSSNIVVSGEVNISNNTAFSGGGMLLCAGAVLYLEREVHLLITNNIATHTGGGIHIERECIINRPRCFFQYDSDTIQNQSTGGPRVTVKDNTAKVAGDNIYGGSVDNCYLINVPHADNSVFTFKKIFHVHNNSFSNKKYASTIASPPRQVCVVDHGKHNCSHVERELYPGQTLVIRMLILGQLNGSVPGTVYLDMDSKFVSVPKNYKVQTVPSKHPKELSYRIYSMKENITTKLYLGVTQIGSGSNSPLEVSVKIKPCPLGFTLQSNRSTQTTCSCDKLRPYARTKLRCSISKRVGIEYQPPVWIGMVQVESTHESLSIAVSGTCPHDYCNFTKQFLDLRTLEVNSTVQCYFNRSGVLCGGCVRGYSLLLGSSKCRRDCSDNYLSLLLFFALAGIVLVFFITFLNLTVTKGTMNGLIFYANTIQIYAFFMFEKNRMYASPFLKVFIAWLNLDFGIETCFFVGMDGFSKALLQFAFPVYIWMIAAAIIVLSRKYAIITKICGKDSVKVLATLILLSYSKILRAAMDALHFTPVHYLFKDGTMKRYVHWTTDGRLRYLEGEHIVIFVVGVTFALGALPFMLTLLCIQKIGLLPNWPCFRWVYKLKPFLDSFTGPFTDRGRFWVGFLLLIRILIMAIYSFNFNSSDVVVLATVVLICFVLLLTGATLPKGIYKTHTLNLLETFFIANLGCMFLGLFCSKYYEDSLPIKTCVVHISIGLSFIVFVSIVAHHVMVRTKCQDLLKQFRRKQQRHPSLASYSDLGESSNSLHQPPYTYTEEREPLLSTMD